MSTQHHPPQDLVEISNSIREAAKKLRSRSASVDEIGRTLTAAAAALQQLRAGMILGIRELVQDLAQPCPTVPRGTRDVVDHEHSEAGATIAAMATERPTPQDLDPHLAERLHQLRRGLGLSVNDMAQRLGLWGANGADNLRQMERCARPLPGTLQVLLGYMEREQSERALREHLDNRAGTKPPYEDLADRMKDTPYRSVAADLSDEQRAELGLPRTKR